MKIAIIENDVVKQVGDYLDLFPNTSFGVGGPSDEWLTDNSCKKVNLFLEFNPLTHKKVSCDPYIDGSWVYTVKVEELSDAEIDNAKETAMAQIRSLRNSLLSACDYTQLPDNPSAKKAEWATYRQALRDLPDQITGDPRTWNNWPHNPDYVAL